MAIAFRAVGAVTGAASGNVASVALPAGHTTNDILLLAAFQHDNVASTVASWTLVGSSAPVATMTTRIFAIRDNGSISAPTLTHTSGALVHCWIAAFSGVDSGLTVGTGAGAIIRDIQFQTGSGTAAITVTNPACSGPVSGDMRCTISAGDTTDTSGVASANWTPPATFTERQDVGRIGATSNYSELATVLSAGTSPAVTASGNGSGFAGTQNWIGCQLLLSQDVAGAATILPPGHTYLQAVNRSAVM